MYCTSKRYATRTAKYPYQIVSSDTEILQLGVIISRWFADRRVVLAAVYKRALLLETAMPGADNSRLKIASAQPLNYFV